MGRLTVFWVVLGIGLNACSFSENTLGSKQLLQPLPAVLPTTLSPLASDPPVPDLTPSPSVTATPVPERSRLLEYESFSSEYIEPDISSFLKEPAHGYVFDELMKPLPGVKIEVRSLHSLYPFYISTLTNARVNILFRSFLQVCNWK